MSSARAAIFAEIDPKRSTSVLERRVRFGETDLMGIVHHASYLSYFEVGRVEWLRRRGLAYADWASRGVHLPVVEANASYKAPARFDDLLAVQTALVELRTVSLEFGYVIRRGETTIAEGSTRLACIDETHRLQRIPDALRDVLLAGETSAG